MPVRKVRGAICPILRPPSLERSLTGANGNHRSGTAPERGLTGFGQRRRRLNLRVEPIRTLRLRKTGYNCSRRGSVTVRASSAAVRGSVRLGTVGGPRAAPFL
jgi:hypothetical protein